MISPKGQYKKGVFVMKKVLFVLLALALCLTATAAFAEKVGVSMPTKDLQRWNQDGANMQAQLEAAGYEVDLQFASNDVQTQLSQVENMINSGCDVMHSPAPMTVARRSTAFTVPETELWMHEEI